MSGQERSRDTVSTAGPVLYNYPIVSILIPCRNEAEFIGACLDSIVNNDYPLEQLEVLVLDGMSDDGTREIVDEYARKYPFLKLVDNQQKTTPVALNLGIGIARAPVLMRMDAHSVYGRHYIKDCLQALGQYSADCVGGIWKVVPRTNSLFGLGVAQALSHPFGVGNARYRYAEGGTPQWVDTVPYFCMKRWKFKEVGLFNESLVRGEDMEFNLRLSQVGLFNEKLTRGQDMEFSLRLKKAGGRTLLLPGVVSYYFARSDIRSFWWHNWDNGVWAILPFAFSDIIPVAGRHLVPLAFVGAVVGAFVLGGWIQQMVWFGTAILVGYGMAAVAASIQIGWKQRDARYYFIMPAVFAILHVSYGLGSLWGLIRLVGLPEFWKKLRWQGLRHALER